MSLLFICDGAVHVTFASEATVVVSIVGAEGRPGTSGKIFTSDFGEIEPSVVAALSAATVNSTLAPFDRPVNSMEVAFAAAVKDFEVLISLTM